MRLQNINNIDMALTGVFAVICIPTGERYVAVARTSFERSMKNFNQHVANDGVPDQLKERWRRYGARGFTFVPLCDVPVEKLKDRLDAIIEKMQPALNRRILRGRPPSDTYEINGRDMTVGEIAKEAGMSRAAIYSRIRRGVTGEDLLRGKHHAPRKQYAYKRT